MSLRRRRSRRIWPTTASLSFGDESSAARATRRLPLFLALGGLDAFVFTTGIGEHSAKSRARIAEKLASLGAVFDVDANTAG